MAAGQPLLSLFSGPIHGNSAKHNQGEPQGTDLIPHRLCDLLHGNWRILQERIRGTEHRVFSQADHVVNSSKTTGHQIGRDEASADVRLETIPARSRGTNATKLIRWQSADVPLPHYRCCHRWVVEAAAHRSAPSRPSRDPRRSEKWGEAATGLLTATRPWGVVWWGRWAGLAAWKGKIKSKIILDKLVEKDGL